MSDLSRLDNLAMILRSNGAHSDLRCVANRRLGRKCCPNDFESQHFESTPRAFCRRMAVTPDALSQLLSITVGTGTAGRHSNLTQGLINTVAQAAPRMLSLRQGLPMLRSAAFSRRMKFLIERTGTDTGTLFRHHECEGF